MKVRGACRASSLLRLELRDGYESLCGWLGIEQRATERGLSITEPSLQLCIEFLGAHSMYQSLEDF